jgi:molybdenum cofactor guanylyltransferase
MACGLSPHAFDRNVYHQRVGDLTAFILAGGRSSRMGRDKAFVALRGRTLLERAMDLAGSITPNVRVVGAKEKFFGVGHTVEDVFPDCGPLGGIHAALTNTETELNLVLAVDLPFVGRDFLFYLISQASQTRALVTVAQAGERLQPLCAVYRREFVQAAEKALKKKKNKIDILFEMVETRVISGAEMERMGFSSTMFQNLNTSEELQKAERSF